jgi:pyruvate dehydrogenase E2 component (dihydrolipoamide acetyltransferase)
MPINILMPALSPTMEEGNLAKWLKAEGDTVSAGDIIAEIETDKATMEVEAVDEGTLGKIMVAEGTEGVKVNAVIAVLLEEGEDASAIGSAPAAAPAPAGPSTEMVQKMYADREHEEIPLDGMRRIIAERLTEAKSTIPHFYLRRSIELDALLKIRSQMNARAEKRSIKLSVNDYIIKASALALQEVPSCNAVWAGDRVLQFKASDVAVAVAIEGGLFTPVLRDADTKALSVLSAEMKDLAARARERKLAPHEYQGGSFAISNLGMMGIENFDAVINPPHASILAIGAGVQAPVVKDGALAIATVMSVTLSVDHRVIDGALGAQFLDAFKGYMEDPLSMLM